MVAITSSDCFYSLVNSAVAVLVFCFNLCYQTVINVNTDQVGLTFDHACALYYVLGLISACYLTVR